MRIKETMPFKNTLLVLLLLTATTWSEIFDEVTSGATLLRSPKVLTGFTYDFANSISMIPYRGLSAGIKEKVEITLSPWQFISGSIKVNLFDETYEPVLFQNGAGAIYAGVKGYSLIELFDDDYVIQIYGGLALSTTSQLERNCELELIASPNVCFSKRSYDRYVYDKQGSYHYRDYLEKGIIINLPLGVRFYWGRGARYFTSLAVVPGAQMASKGRGVNPKGLIPTGNFRIGVNWGPQLRKRRAQRRRHYYYISQ